MRILAIAILALAACSGSDPEWARTPASGIAGESTIGAAPAPVARFAVPPTVDGKLDDAAWQSATALGPFVDPGEGQPAPAGDPVFAFARAGWDDQSLYFGFIVRDPDPAQPFSAAAVDPHVWSKSSAVEIMLQPGDPKDHNDNHDYYEIQIDTKGAIFDSHFDDYNSPITGAGDARLFGHQDWSSHAAHAAYIARGRFYSIELAIPWSSFPPARTPIPPRAGDTWRVDLYSFRDGQRRALAWSPLRHQGNFHKASRFGRIQFH